MSEAPETGAIAFALVYLVFFLDNVLLTVLVPIIPDWIRGESLALWSQHNAPLVALLNTTVHEITAERVSDMTVGRDKTGSSAGVSQAVVGAVLAAKAVTQVAVAPLAALTVCKNGPAHALRTATLLLIAASLVFTLSSGRVGCVAALCAGGGRVAHGAGSALAGVGGLALARAAAGPNPARAHRAIAALLGAVALGVLVGYPFGGAVYSMWSPGAPFLLLTAALFVCLVMQYMFLEKVEYNRPIPEAANGESSPWSVAVAARHESAAACAGAVLLTTSVMAALEPCLPLWIMDKFHTQRGVVFIPDSVGYLLATSVLGAVARRLGAERVAITGQLCVGLAALAVPHAASVSGLVLPHTILGAGLGATDAALVPALLARSPSRVPGAAALLQTASSAAYAVGPVVGGMLSWCIGFETAMRTLGVLNLLYSGVLYQALSLFPLSEQWGASPVDDDEDDVEGEITLFNPQQYTTIH